MFDATDTMIETPDMLWRGDSVVVPSAEARTVISRDPVGFQRMGPTAKPLIVLVLEDGPALRRRLVDLISAIDGVDVLIEAADAPTALALASKHCPQIVVLDIRVPGNDRVRNGLDVLGAIKRDRPDTGAIILTNFAEERYVTLARQLGADVFLDKSADFDALVSTIEAQIETRRGGG